MGEIRYTQSPQLIAQDIDFDELLEEMKPKKYYAKQTHIDFEVLKLKDTIIKQLQEENAALKEEIEDLKMDLKTFIEMEN
jgi:cell division protein FtsB